MLGLWGIGFFLNEWIMRRYNGYGGVCCCEDGVRIYQSDLKETDAGKITYVKGREMLDMGGYNTASSLDDFPTDKAMLIVTLSEAGTLTSFRPRNGVLERSMTIYVRNVSGGDVMIPVTGMWEWDGWNVDVLHIDAGQTMELRIVKADRNYVMYSVKY
jgi:hypothetical protein